MLSGRPKAGVAAGLGRGVDARMAASALWRPLAPGRGTGGGGIYCLCAGPLETQSARQARGGVPAQEARSELTFASSFRSREIFRVLGKISQSIADDSRRKPRNRPGTADA
jgi:hypothetical protein